MLSRALRRLRARRHDDQGMTVVELVVASALLLMVTTLIFSFMISVQNTDRRAQAVVNNEQDARFVLTEISRDIRASNPGLGTFATVNQYRNQVQMTLGEGATLKRVRWVYETSSSSSRYKELRREVLDNTTGAVVSSSTRLRRVQNIVRSPVVDLFKYYSQSGVDLVAAGNTPADAANVGNCSIRVAVTITADSNPGPEPFTVTQDVEVRNRLPGGIACPV